MFPNINKDCQNCGKKVGWIGVNVNIVLVIMKVAVGITSGSNACLADALHSSSNIITAFAIFISRRLIGKPMDDDHPYGHGKVEFIAAAMVSVIILILTVVLVVTSFEHIIYNHQPPPHLTALLIAVVSIATNEILFRYFRCVGTRLKSQTIIANAWANRADCFSSLAVVIGVIGARFGFHHLDPIAAVIVAGIIIKVSIDCLKDSIAGLMDRSLPTSTIEELRRSISNLESIDGIGRLQARLLGDKLWVDVAVNVSPKYTVVECETIRRSIQKCLFNCGQDVGYVLVDFETTS